MVPTGDSCAPDHHHRAPLIADSIAPITPDDYPSIVDRYILELHKISQVGGILRGDRTGPEVVAALAGHIGFPNYGSVQPPGRNGGRADPRPGRQEAGPKKSTTRQAISSMPSSPLSVQPAKPGLRPA